MCIVVGEGGERKKRRGIISRAQATEARIVVEPKMPKSPNHRMCIVLWCPGNKDRPFAYSPTLGEEGRGELYAADQSRKGIAPRVYRIEHLGFLDLDSCGRGFRTALKNLLAMCVAKDANLGGDCWWTPGDSPDGLVEDALEVPLGQRRALEVLAGADLLGAGQGLLVRHRLHALGPQGVEGGGVFAEIELGADEDDGDVGRVVVDLGVPLGRCQRNCMQGCVGGALRGRGVPWP